MKNIITLLSLFAFSFSALLGSVIAQSAWAGADLIGAGKSDSAIKMLVFPKSLRVIENQGNAEINITFSDPKRIHKTLLKVDPARVVPAKVGEPFKGPVTRDSLRQLANQYSEDILFIFRRKLGTEKKMLRHQGLLYLARQKKVLTLKGSMESGSGHLQEMDVAGLNSLAQEAKKILYSNKFEKRQSAY